MNPRPGLGFFQISRGFRPFTIHLRRVVFLKTKTYGTRQYLTVEDDKNILEACLKYSGYLLIFSPQPPATALRPLAQANLTFLIW